MPKTVSPTAWNQRSQTITRCRRCHWSYGSEPPRGRKARTCAFALAVMLPSMGISSAPRPSDLRPTAQLGGFGRPNGLRRGLSLAGEARLALLHEGAEGLGQVVRLQERRVPDADIVEPFADGA